MTNSPPRTAPTAVTDTHREVLGQFASGVTVVTAYTADGPAGFTCQSFASLSLDPPLVSLAVARTSGTWPLIRGTGTFCVNVLSRGQEDVSTAFARSGTDRFRGVHWSPGPGGAPLLDGACAWIACELQHEYDGGDHVIAVARITALGATPARDPLIYHRGRYRRLTPAA